MHKLHDVRSDDEKSVNEFVYKKAGTEIIEDIKLIWDHETTRGGDTWEGIAIKFREDLTQYDLISAIVSLSAEEYWGMQDGYHLFWFD